MKCILVTTLCPSACSSVPCRIPTLLHGPGYKLEEWYRCPLVVHSWADLQLVHGFRCYDNIAPKAKCQPVLVLAVCLVLMLNSVQIVKPFQPIADYFSVAKYFKATVSFTSVELAGSIDGYQLCGITPRSEES